MSNLTEQEAQELLAKIKAMAEAEKAPSPAEFQAVCIGAAAYVADLANANRKPGDKWIVYVDDNFHFMDEEERYQLGEFETEEEAVAAAKRIVDEFLHDGLPLCDSPEQLYERYTGFGDDPWIPGSTFHAWRYAREQCYRLYSLDGKA